MGTGNYKCKLCGAFHSGGANTLCPDCKSKGGKLHHRPRRNRWRTNLL